MTKQTKIYQVEDIKTRLEGSRSAALVDYQGLSAEQIAALRKEVKETGGVIEVAKNTLVQRALSRLGIELPEKLVGPTAVVYCEKDEVTPLKAIKKTADIHKKPEFKYGIYQNKLLSLDQLKELISLPSREQLLASLLSGLQSPLSRLTHALKFNQVKLLLTLKAATEKN